MNSKLKAVLATATLVASMTSVGGAMANTNRTVGSSVDQVQVAAITPLSMQFFCAKNRSECASSGQGQVTMSPNLMAVLKQVNSHVNRTIRPERDTADVWELNPTSGDCEDYVLSKRSALIRQGVSAGALRVAYTHTRSGEPHAVLVVRTSDGDYVLDNLNNSIKTLRASGYNIRTISSPNPTQWTAG